MSQVKWLWFIIQVGAFVIVAHHLIVLFKAAAEAKGGEIAQLYGKVRSAAAPRRVHCTTFRILRGEIGEESGEHVIPVPYVRQHGVSSGCKC